MLVMDEGKCGVSVAWLRWCQMAPSNTTLNVPFAELTKFRMSMRPPSSMRRFVVAPPFFGSLLKFWQSTFEPLPVMMKSFVTVASDELLATRT